MTRKVVRSESDGKYHVNGRAFPHLMGTRAQVWHGTAYKTKAGLTKNNFKMNARGRIVSKLRSTTAKKRKVLFKLGYRPVKGKPFTPMRRKSSAVAASTKTRRS